MESRLHPPGALDAPVPSMHLVLGRIAIMQLAPLAELGKESMPVGLILQADPSGMRSFWFAPVVWMHNRNSSRDL
eukprot:3925124-Amphidinium_carterae.1